jgi:hypothetical protein
MLAAPRAPQPQGMDCGGKRSATPLSEPDSRSESGVAAALCHRSPNLCCPCTELRYFSTDSAGSHGWERERGAAIHSIPTAHCRWLGRFRFQGDGLAKARPAPSRKASRKQRAKVLLMFALSSYLTFFTRNATSSLYSGLLSARTPPPCVTSSDLPTLPVSVLTHSARYRPAGTSSIKVACFPPCR